MQYLNTLTVFALVVASFALIVAVPVLYASSEDSGRSNRLILLGSAVWVALVLLNWGGASSSSEDRMATFEDVYRCVGTAHRRRGGPFQRSGHRQIAEWLSGLPGSSRR